MDFYSDSVRMEAAHRGATIPVVTFTTSTDNQLTENQRVLLIALVAQEFGAEVVSCDRNTFWVSWVEHNGFFYRRATWDRTTRADSFEELFASIAKCVRLRRVTT